MSSKPFNPIPDLPNLLKNEPTPEAAKTEKVRKPRELGKYACEPVYIKKLIEHYQSKSTVADLIGVSAPVIYDAVDDNIVTKAYEVAAKLTYMELIEKPQTRRVAVSALVRQDIWEMLEPWLQSAGVSYQCFKS